MTRSWLDQTNSPARPPLRDGARGRPVAGRPPLRIGSHGKITRTYVGGGVWLARTRFRDSDGVTRIVERRGPADEHDQYGKQAEDALIEALNQRLPAGGSE